MAWYEWVFSGIGVTAIAGLVALRRNKTPAQARDTRKPSRPTPNEIEEEWRKKTPYQRIGGESRWNGLKVSWPVRLMDIDPAEDGRYRVLFFFGNYPKTSIAIWARYSALPPIMKSAPKEARWWISGTIASFSQMSMSIDLEDNPKTEVKWPGADWRLA